MSKEVLALANKCANLDELLRRSTIKTRGFKAVGQRARVLMNEIKKDIPKIKKIILENEK